MIRGGRSHRRSTFSNSSVGTPIFPYVDIAAARTDNLVVRFTRRVHPKRLVNRTIRDSGNRPALGCDHRVMTGLNAASN